VYDSSLKTLITGPQSQFQFRKVLLGPKSLKGALMKINDCRRCGAGGKRNCFLTRNLERFDMFGLRARTGWLESYSVVPALGGWKVILFLLAGSTFPFGLGRK